MMNIEVGKSYQSRSFPHITRKVLSVKNGVVRYSIIDSKYPDAPYCKMQDAVESEFRNICTRKI